MEREACVCDHGFERSDLCAEIIIIIIIIMYIDIDRYMYMLTYTHHLLIVDIYTELEVRIRGCCLVYSSFVRLCRR